MAMGRSFNKRDARKLSQQQKQARQRKKARGLLLENLEPRHLMAGIPGPVLAGIQPNNGTLLTNNATLKVAPNDLTFLFTNGSGLFIDTNTLGDSTTVKGIELRRAGTDGKLQTADDVIVKPGYISTGDTGLEVTMRFASQLPNDNYQITIRGSGPDALKDTGGRAFNEGVSVIRNFKLDLGATIQAVVPQPVTVNNNGTLTQALNRIDVYFNSDTLNEASAENVNFYQLINTNNTVTPIDDAAPGNIFKPTAVTYDKTQNKATLTFASNLHTLNTNSYAWRLRIGTDESIDATTYTPIAANDPLSTFAGALNTGNITGTEIYNDAISPRPYTLQYPGGNDDPGHRDNPGPNGADKHLPDDAADTTNGVTTQFYNFQRVIGSISNGSGGSQLAFNFITENQKQRVREVFELYNRFSGIQFVETQNLGLTVATGDLRVADPDTISEPGGVLGLGGGNIAVMDVAERDWNDQFGGNYFDVAMHEIGHALGLGHTYELAAHTIMGENGRLTGQSPAPEPVFPGDADIIHMRRLYRPEGQDIDMYRFVVPQGQAGQFTAEVMAERLQNSSNLDSYLRLYRQGNNGPELISVNDDYFSKDSLIQLNLTAGTYYVGVSAKGNDKYDPTIPDSGIGGTTEGSYRLLMNFRPTVAANRSIVDLTGTPLDGDADGTPGGTYNFWFKTAQPHSGTGTAHTAPRTFFVNKDAAAGGNGSLNTPFNNIPSAIAAATVAGDIIRIVGNGGADNDITTLGDNLAYQIGFEQVNNSPLPDGASLIVPKQVTVMVDAGAVFQMRRSRIQVGSTQTTSGTDRSGGALQVLGVPGQNVYFTSYNDATIGKNTNPLNIPNTRAVLPNPGDWGGILFRHDQDRADGRFDWEQHGIFLDHVGFADIRYGGGQVNLDGGSQAIINPIHMVDARPAATYNIITLSSDAAMSASPNSFEETTFREPQYQPDGTYARAFTVDYSRIGPDIHGNTLAVPDKRLNANNQLVDYVRNNSINGLFVRAQTPAGGTVEELTVTGRFNDTDITHVVAENFQFHGSPSGAILEGAIPNPADATIQTGKPPVNLVIVAPRNGGSLATGTYNYRLVFVDQFGAEGRASDVRSVTLAAGEGSVNFSQLPRVPVRQALRSDYNERFIARRLYRAGSDGVWRFVAQIPDTVTTFTDTGRRPDFDRILNPNLLTATLGESRNLQRMRIDAGLKIDPNMIVKFDTARIEMGLGTNLIAEGSDGQRVIFTSISDDRFGAGGIFDTRSDGNKNLPTPGDWGGRGAGPHSRLSLDYASIFYAGGINRVEGNFVGFNPVEIHEADARVANSVFQFNANGTGGTGQADRFGRGANSTASIFVRGAQPVLVNNIIRDNEGAAMSFNVNSLNNDLVVDLGRQSGFINPSAGNPDLVDGFLDNQGPLIRGNLISGNGTLGSGYNGLVVRGGLVTTESVWDDTDIVHIMLDLVSVTDFHTYGGLRLESRPKESLVVKSKTLNQTSPAGIYANGNPLDNIERIGGIVQVLGQPGFPVVMTSLGDDTVGAGFQPDGRPNVDTDNNGAAGNGLLPTGPEVNNGTLIDNDVDLNTPGFFSIQPGDGGQVDFSSLGGVTASGNSQIFINQNFIFLFQNYIDVGSDGGAIPLANTTITSPATLISPDRVRSTGTFTGANGLVTWQVDTFLVNGEARVNNQITFTSPTPLGNLRLINYLDEDVTAGGGLSNNLLALQGTPGQDDFRAFTLDNNERIGFSQGGYVTAGSNMVAAKFDGWAADSFPNLDNAISGAGTTYSIAGNINTTNLTPFNDPSLGQVYGLADITTAFAWSVDATATASKITSILELVAQPPSAVPGDWMGIVLDKYSHDRNVDTILEQEDPSLVAPGSNGTPIRAQAIGALAPDLKSGDETNRYGYTLHGQLSSPRDVDVYSFTAQAGTEVWFDIDRTTQALDTIVELIDSDGVVLSRSNNSPTEANGGAGLVGDAKRMQKTPPYQGIDYYTQNPRDAGFRVVLPGPTGTRSPYYVRVRSASSTLTNIAAGTTEGAYRLQLRLRERDEVGGSVIRLGDIRFATNGIEVRGQPIHSPLVGENVDLEAPGGAGVQNNSLATAQSIGNIGNADRGTISVAGTINAIGDVDWYRFNVDIRELQGLSDSALFQLMFDIDYADVIGRPNTNISVFDEQGRLIYISRDSNIADDRPAPLSADNIEDLLRGSAGNADAFIGPVSVAAGASNAALNTYYVAISNDTQLPGQFAQFLQKIPSAPIALSRLEPIRSIERIVEDHQDADLIISTATPPQVTNLFDDTSVVPWTLGDVKLFVSRESYNGVDPISDLVTVNPFTGAYGAYIGSQGLELGDIAFRPGDEQLFGYTKNVRDTTDPDSPTDANSGNYININTGDGTTINLGNNSIQTFEYKLAGAIDNIQRAHFTNGNRVGWGVQFEALSFGDYLDNGLNDLIAIGSRGENYTDVGNKIGQLTGNSGINADIFPQANLVYQMNQTTGQSLINGGPMTYTPAGAANPIFEGALTTAYEVGEIITSPRLRAADVTTGTIANTNFNVQDGDSFTVVHPTGRQLFQFDTGPEVVQTINLTNANTIRDGNFFILDPDNDTNNTNEIWFQFNTGRVISVNTASAAAIPDGETFSINDNKGRVSTFEFDRDGTQNNKNAVLIDMKGSLGTLTVAGIMGKAINTEFAAGNTNVQAFVTNNRISLLNENAVGFSPGLEVATLMHVEGGPGNAPILQAVPGSQITDGQIFTINRFNQPVRTFEFDSGNGVALGNTKVPFTAAMTALQVANSMNASLQSLNKSVTIQQVGTRIVLNGLGSGANPNTGNNLFAQGTSPIINLLTTETVIPIDTEESRDATGVGIDVAAAINGNNIARFSVGHDLSRINFPPVTSAVSRPVVGTDFSGVPRWTVRPASQTGVSAGSVAIPIFAEDADTVLATRISSVINATFADNTFSTANSDRVLIQGNGTFGTADAPLVIEQNSGGPGGFVTGSVIIEAEDTDRGRMFVVSNKGGLYEIDMDLTNNRILPNDDPDKINQVTTRYVQSSRSELEGINFQALVQGPREVENGRYAKLLFGVSDTGRLYAFDFNGQLQPIFNDGATSIQLQYFDPLTSTVQPMTDVRGLAFSALNSNLWHQAGDARPGHTATSPTNSLYFGDETGAQTVTPGTYDAPGGASGSIVSNEFSLVGYGPNDKPYLYYNYFLGSEESAEADSVRVYISGNDPGNNRAVNPGQWFLIASDEIGVEDPLAIHQDNSGFWRQVRIPLQEYAGLDKLRLRIDFTTSGDSNAGDTFTTGDELRAVPGDDIEDGDRFVIDGQTFEFNNGVTLHLPPGSEVVDGDTFTIVKNFLGNTFSRTFEFNRTGGIAATSQVAIPYTGNETPAQMAQLVVNAVRANFTQQDTLIGRNQTNSVIPRYIAGQSTVNFDFASLLNVRANSALRRTGFQGVPAGNTTVNVHPEMTRDEVAIQIQNVLDAYYYQQTLSVGGVGSKFNDGDRFTISANGKNFNFEFETGLIINIPTGGGDLSTAKHVVDGDKITITRTDPTTGTKLTQVTLEFDSNNSNPPNAITYTAGNKLTNTPGDSQLVVAQAVQRAIQALPAATLNTLGILAPFPRLISGSRVQIGGTANLTFASSNAAVTVNGKAGVTANHTPVRLIPSDFTSAKEIANQIFIAANPVINVNGLSIAYDPILDGSRIQLLGVEGNQYLLGRIPVTPGGNIPLNLDAASNLFKRHKDLIRVVGHNVDNRGPLGLNDYLPGDYIVRDPADPDFIIEVAQGYHSNKQGQNNKFEGLRLDDFIIGFAERGEMMTTADTTTAFINNPLQQPAQTVVGDYQLEIRRGPKFEGDPLLAPLPSYHTNERLMNGLQLSTPDGANLADGRTFTLSDGNNQVRFEYNLVGDTNVTPGNQVIPYLVTSTAAQIALATRNAINSNEVQLTMKIQAQLDDGSLDELSVGDFPARVSNSNRLNLIGEISVPANNAVTIEAREQKYGDQNQDRDQGQLILDGNRVSNSLNWGIFINAGERGDSFNAKMNNDTSTASHQGPVRILREENLARLVPGVVVSNNVVYENGLGGIRFAGTPDVANAEQGSVAFGRIVNNTLYGRGGAAGGGNVNDVGVQIDSNASPTLMNNIISNFATGITRDATSTGTVIGGTVFKENTANTNFAGTLFNTYNLQPTSPLFINPAQGNFYLAPGSLAIDSSVDSLPDRAALVTVRNPLGIPPSPILAPDYDSAGQLRIDDPTVNSPGGSGANVFKDRGALDRVDFLGPTSQLANPVDNDTKKLDSDPRTSYVTLANVSLFNFTIQLLDQGIGIDDSTVVSRAVQVKRFIGNTVKNLRDGVDYNFIYDSTNNTIILRPTGGIWTAPASYRIFIDNTLAGPTDTIAIRDRAQNLLQPNRPNGTVTYDVLIGTAIDYGDAPNSASLKYPVLQASQGASHGVSGAIFLGRGVTPDADGQPSPTASADTDDGMSNGVFSPGVLSTMTVNGRGNGVLDAWLDSNFNGVWEASEKLTFLNGSGLNGGTTNATKTFQFRFGNVGGPLGTTYLRLRYSTNGIAVPTGAASDGEVEDYQVSIVKAPYQNPTLRWDVNNDGVVKNEDALLISNLIANFDINGDGVVNPLVPDAGAPAIAPAPPYYDVNGDGLITRADAAEVLAYLQSPPAIQAPSLLASTTSTTTKKASTTDSDAWTPGVDDFFSQF